ncbi:MAG: lysylphosphatidylglycerol synthase transmembrane domain-containing protein [Candidatus Binatia bacterium]|nr:lysylphosphatidylglycerol synthase transmembrane domain-containing protein [Candidatus Binatia bacterium]
MSRAIQIAVSLIITAAALWYSLAGVEFGEFLHDLGDARLIWLIPLVASSVGSLWLRARRWRILLETLGPIGDTPVFDATNIGFMGNMVLPLRAGEAIKPIVVARSGYVSIPAALATVALERLCDLIMLGLFAVLTLVLVPQADFLQGKTSFVAAGVGVALAGVVLVIRLAPWLEQKLDVVAGWLPEFLGGILREAGRGFLRSLAGLADMRVLVPVFVFTTVIWLLTVSSFMAVALALDIDAPLIALGFATTVIVALAVSVPSAPGFIGVFWAGSEVALGLFDIPKSMGFTFGVLSWLVQLVVIVLMGMWSMSRLKLSLADVREAASSEESA